jgi:hypothetical protein
MGEEPNEIINGGDYDAGHSQQNINQQLDEAILPMPAER